MESREACEIKLDESALKFVTGRIDCNNANEVLECVSEEDITEHGLEDAGFITCKHEVMIQDKSNKRALKNYVNLKFWAFLTTNLPFVDIFEDFLHFYELKLLHLVKVVFEWPLFDY